MRPVVHQLAHGGGAEAPDVGDGGEMVKAKSGASRLVGLLGAAEHALLVERDGAVRGDRVVTGGWVEGDDLAGGQDRAPLVAELGLDALLFPKLVYGDEGVVGEGRHAGHVGDDEVHGLVAVAVGDDREVRHAD